MKTLLVSCALALCIAAPAAADPVNPYDGRKPFKCDTQNVGTGVAFPHPAADPFCVRFDKTNQDVAGLGVLEFLANEPARVAAALGKCFYFQRDEWTGSILPGGEFETYHWRGAYFFDLARGGGGVFVKEVRLGGQSAPASWVSIVPEPLRPFVHATGGGGYVAFDVPVDPRCAAMVDTGAERRLLYRRWYRKDATS